MTDETLVEKLLGWAKVYPVSPMAEAADRITSLEEEKRAILKVRDGYASQMKFCDIEALGYFREFVRRIDTALSAGVRQND